MPVLGWNSDDLMSIPSRMGTAVAFYCNKCIFIDKYKFDRNNTRLTTPSNISFLGLHIKLLFLSVSLRRHYQMMEMFG